MTDLSSLHSKLLFSKTNTHIVLVVGIERLISSQSPTTSLFLPHSVSFVCRDGSWYRSDQNASLGLGSITVGCAERKLLHLFIYSSINLLLCTRHS